MVGWQEATSSSLSPSLLSLSHGQTSLDFLKSALEKKFPPTSKSCSYDFNYHKMDCSVFMAAARQAASRLLREVILIQVSNAYLV